MVKEEYPEIIKFEDFMKQEIEIDFYDMKLCEEISNMQISPSIVKILAKYLFLDCFR